MVCTGAIVVDSHLLTFLLEVFFLGCYNHYNSSQQVKFRGCLLYSYTSFAVVHHDYICHLVNRYLNLLC
jgi:hypothetical protein